MTLLRSNRSVLLAFGIAIVTAVAFACSTGGDDDGGGGGGPTGPTTGGISGTVSDRAGQGVPGANVTVTQGTATRQAVSAGDGTFDFSNLATGAWSIDVTPPTGFERDENLPKNVVVQAGSSVSTTLALRRVQQGGTGSITGTVTAGSTAVAGATLRLTAPGGGTTNATTNAQGTYLFANLAAGAYTVQITPPTGFQLAQGEQASKPANVTDGMTTTVDFSLQATTGGAVVVINLTDNLQFEGPNGASTTTITAGTTVRWVNVSSVFHTVTSRTNLWASQNMPSGGQAFEVTFPTAGTFDYFCIPHEGVGMTGRIIVQ